MYEPTDEREDSDYDYPYSHFKKKPPAAAAKRRHGNKPISNSNRDNTTTATLLSVTPKDSDYENADDINEYMEMID